MKRAEGAEAKAKGESWAGLRRLVLKVPPNLRQYIKFGLVGGLATALHSGLFVGLVELLGLAPVLANAIAFAVAFSVTYLGNNHWTFGVGRTRLDSLARSLAVSLIGFLLNSAFILLVTKVFGQSYLLSLPFMIGVVPLVVFWLNKHWVFKAAA